MWVMKKTQYGGYVVMFLPNKIIKNKNLNYPQKNVGLTQGFKTMCMVLNLCAHGFAHGMCMVLKPCTTMVLKPCARPFKQPMVLLYMV